MVLAIYITKNQMATLGMLRIFESPPRQTVTLNKNNAW